MTETRWWMIRHAPVIGNGGQITGQIDLDADVSSVTPSPRLPANPKAVVISPLARTRQTALALGYAPTHVEADLAEQHFGAWQGKRWDEIDPNDSAAFWADGARNRPPQGESFVDVEVRVTKTLERLSASIGDGDIVAVLHDGSIRAGLYLALALDPLKSQAFVLDNLSLTRLDRTSQGWRVGCVNERLFA